MKVVQFTITGQYEQWKLFLQLYTFIMLFYLSGQLNKPIIDVSKPDFISKPSRTLSLLLYQ